MKIHNPPHPGAIIADNIKALNMSLRNVAKALDVSASTLQRLTDEQAAISPEMAIRLSKVIGSTPEWWLRMQNAHSLHQAESKIDFTKLSPLLTPPAENMQS